MQETINTLNEINILKLINCTNRKVQINNKNYTLQLLYTILNTPFTCIKSNVIIMKLF